MVKRQKKRQIADPEASTSNKRACTLQSTTFDWSNLCFLCGEEENRKKNNKHSVVSEANAEIIKLKVSHAAEIRNDFDVQRLLDGNIDSYSKSARYHLHCYQNYTNERALNSIVSSSDENKSPNIPFDEIARDTVLFYREKFETGDFIRLPSLCEHFKNALVESGFKTSEEVESIKSSFIKSKLEKVTEFKVKFHSCPGKSDIVTSSQFSIIFLFHKLIENARHSVEKIYEKSEKDVDNISLHRAAAIIRREIDGIPPTETYNSAKEVSIKYSRTFVPEPLQKLICWIIDEVSFNQGLLVTDDKNHSTTLRRTLSISESLIYCSKRTSKNSIIPPFHLGLTLQLHHMFGKKSLIDILHSHGFCCSNDDLRYFLTLAAEKELEKSVDVYVPSGLINRANGGKFIQEGDDNVDINTQTIDGKNTYHAMARVVFQVQEGDESIETERIPRINKRRSLENHHQDSFQVLYYQKPNVRPAPPTFDGAVDKLQNILEHRNTFSVTDIGWALLRNISRGIFSKGNIERTMQIIPSWVAFNTRFANETSIHTNVLYIPPINAKPSDLSTVYTTLKKGQELMKACGQMYSVHTFDQQLYTIAQYVKFDRQEELSNVVLRMGGFHTSCVFISCIGKIWGDAGLRTMLVESNVYAANTVDQMLEGKQFHRALRGLTLCYEVLLYLLYENFFEWLSEIDEASLHNLCQLYTDFHAKYSADNCEEESLKILIMNSQTMLKTRLNEFRNLRRLQSPTFQFWDECLQSLQILLEFNRAQREGDWNLDLSSQVSMLPYFFACNKQNYARWSTYYVLEMMFKLPEEVKHEFLTGNFSVKFTPGSFRGVWSDIAVEMSVIKDTKSDTGIIGFTRKDSTVLRWAITRNILGAYSSIMLNRSGCSKDDIDSKYKHEGERQHEISRDEEHYGMILARVKDHMQDPFSTSVQNDSIINIGSNLIASSEIHTFLSNFLSIGEKKLMGFVSSRLENDTQNRKQYYDPITQTNMKTFSDTKKKTVVKINGQIVKKVISPETVLQRALAISQNRKDVDLRLILSTPLTAIPSSLFQPDGCRRTTDKSDFMHAIERDIASEITKQLPSSEELRIIIIDGMAELQSLSSKSFTDFNSLGNIILQSIIHRLSYADEVHLVFDRYDDDSPNPKQAERDRRYGIGGKTYNIRGSGILSDFKKILSNDKNKSNLTKFICDYLKEHLPLNDFIIRNTHKKVFVSGGLEPRADAFLINHQGCEVDVKFHCNHLDADTRMILHVQCIQRTVDQEKLIIVESPDTDVFILLLAHFQHFENLSQLWFFTGKISIRTDLRRYIPIHLLAGKLGNPLCSSLLAAHALTGCDTTSSLFYIGKITVYSALKKMSDEELNDLSRINDLSADDLSRIVNIFLSYLYDPKKKSKATRTDINSLRYHLAIEKNYNIARLPPSQPAMLKHTLRALWQINEWKQATKSLIVSHDVLLFGWLIENEKLEFDYYDGPTAVETLQKYFCSCSGKNACTTDSCPCVQSNLKCCDVCNCNDSCDNVEEIKE